MAEKKKYNSILISGRKDQTLTYSKYVKDEESGESVKESLDKKVNITDELTTQQIKDGAITNEKMAADSVGNTNLQNGSVSNEKLEDGSITNEKLAENSITNDKLKDNTIGVEKLDPELRQTINAATGLPENLVETIQNVDDTLKYHQSQLDEKQSQIDDKQQQITANDEDISLLQTRSTQMEEAIKGISASGGASQATAVTYENTESGLNSVTAQGAIDELANKKINKENIAQEFGDSKDNVVSQFALPFREIESPEFIKAIVDAEDHFLFGIKLDGSIEWGKGIPAPIRTKLQEIINQCQQDKTDILEAINTAKKELSANIAKLQEGKVDKEEGKSLISSDFASAQSSIESPEYIQVTADSNSKILQGIKSDGTSYIGGDLEVNGKASISGDATVRGNLDLANESIQSVDNPEYLKVTTDAQGKVLNRINKDGSHYIHNVKSESLDALNKKKVDKVEGKELSTNDYTNEEKELVRINEIVDSSEYIKTEVDSEDKILSGRTRNGRAFENIGFDTKDISIDGNNVSNNEDQEERIKVETDNENKILSYRDKQGVLHEPNGIITDYIELSENGQKKLQDDLNKAGYIPNSYNIKDFRLPKFGYCDIISETFYLTADSRVQDVNDVYVILDYPDTDENARLKLTIGYYYIKSTLTDNGDGTYNKNDNSVKLDFYAATKVTKVNDKYYVTDSLVDSKVVPESIEVTQIVDTPDVRTWSVDKKTEHNCVVNIDFGKYLRGTFYVGVKFQGSSTLEYRKRNLRFTFYKNSSYAKKNKIKIGEFVKTSGFNLKSNWTDDSKMKELIMNRIFIGMWEDRDIYAQYPWNKEFTLYNDACGIIKGFPVEVKIGGEFWGLNVFGLKKDEKNYMLDGDDDSSGIFVSCEGFGGVKSWTITTASDWADEMEAVKPMSQETTDALNTFFDFINDRLTIDGNLIPFNRFTAIERMDIIGFIDYFICLQVFQMWDNGYRNMILYSGRDKKKFYPFMYDLDLSLNRPYNMDFFDITNPQSDTKWDLLIWEKLVDLYWDEIVNRYRYLRGRILSIDAIDKVYHDVVDSIPDDVFVQEQSKWKNRAQKSYFLLSEELLRQRLSWLDKSYFKI